MCRGIGAWEELLRADALHGLGGEVGDVGAWKCWVREWVVFFWRDRVGVVAIRVGCDGLQMSCMGALGKKLYVIASWKAMPMCFA